MRAWLVPLVVLLSAHLALAEEYAHVAVTESDFATLRKLQYAETLKSTRTSYDRQNAAKHEAEFQQTLKAAGWSSERLDEVRGALAEVVDLLSYEKGDEEGASMEDIRHGLSLLNKTTIATARAHYKELREGGDDDQRADEQVRRERAEAAAGEAPTAAAIAGAWVPDLEATFNDLMPGMKVDAKIREPMEKATDGLSYTFGPGNAVVATSKGTDGKPKVEKGTYRIEGRTIFFKADGSTREHTLDAGLKGKHLMLGRGFGKVLYRKK